MVAVLPPPCRHPDHPESQPTRHKRTWPPVAIVLACLAVGGRVVIAPILLILIFVNTSYLTGANVLIEASDSYFAFSEMDRVMIGGCTGCNRSCRMAMLHFSAFERGALMSKPIFQELQVTDVSPESRLTGEALAIADILEEKKAVCFTGINEWGSPHTIISGEAQEILNVITTLQISVAPRMLRELEFGIAFPENCRTKWTMNSILRRYTFQTMSNSIEYSSVSAADFSVFPDYTECRPNISVDNLVDSRLALATNGEDRLAVVPDTAKLFPFDFESSLADVPRVVPAENTIYDVSNVTQPLFRGYYGGCRVCEVNTTGVFVEVACNNTPHWESYGLMLQAPDDLPVCSTDNICVHNFYNSLWEWVTQVDFGNKNRVKVILNVFRSRFGDTVHISVLPGMVVVQMLLMGIISCYQVMSHKRSVLLTQIWAYRCQNGRMQLLYFVQVTYHLVSNSDVYYLGLATGTLTVESLSNLTFCFFAFSYSFVNMLKARSGEQQLARHFRLVWELIQLVMVSGVASTLYSFRVASLSFIIDMNGELLRKTSDGGAALCKLRDSCVVFKHNVALALTIVSLGLGFIAASVAMVLQKQGQQRLWGSDCQSATIDNIAPQAVGPHVSPGGNAPTLSKALRIPGFHHRVNPKHEAISRLGPSENCIPRKLCHQSMPLTSFERHCLGVPFSRLFTDCSDIAYVKHKGGRCSSVEAVLLTGFLFYGKHVYQAQDVVILLLARCIPRKLIRTFNVLLVRWRVNEQTGRVSFPQSCTWFVASRERDVLSEARPIA